MEDEEQIKLRMAKLECCYSYSQTQIDEYINRGLSNFMKLGGNIPFTDFMKKNKWESAMTDIPVNERFYLAKQPFAYCGGIKADYEYKKPLFSEKDCAPITGLNLISLTTHKTTCLDVRNLLIRGRFINGEIYSSKGTINTYIFSLIKNAIPYITLREVLQGLVQFIGNKHIYFEVEIVRGKKYVEWSSEPISCSRRILNGYFAENVCYTSR